MFGRHVAVTLVALAAVGALAGCYTPPQPDCGFACGPGGACPADYSCAADNVCHRIGSTPDMRCTIDAAIDAPPRDAPPRDTVDADIAGPFLVTSLPVSGATDVAVDSSITVTFSEPVTGIGTTSFVVSTAGTPQTGTIAPDTPEQFTFTPSAPLPAAAQIDVTLTSDITDYSGNVLLPTAFSFTTAP